MEGGHGNGTLPAQTGASRTSSSSLRVKYNPILIGINPPRDVLHVRIHDRLEKRLKSGMIAEARRLHKPIKDGGAGLSWKRMEELGLEYRYMALFLQGMMTRGEMTEKLEIEIRRYAKRQMTWFARDRRINWIEPRDGRIDKRHIDMILYSLNNALKKA